MPAITTLIDEPSKLDLELRHVTVITRGTKQHDELNNLDYEHSGHTGFASSSDLADVRALAEGKVGSVTFDTYNDLLIAIGITPQSGNNVTYSNLHLNSTTLTYKGKTYTLQNNFLFLVVEDGVPDYWVSVDNMMAYIDETDLTKVKSDISLIQSDVSTLQGSVSTLQGNVSTLQNDVSDLQSAVSLLQTDIADKASEQYVDDAISDAVGDIETLLSQI